ncbi:MAG TPA: hypothetical protein VHW92_06680 [Mycobacteriales bacterium]|jgi:hypothetical protein|nr:hypothetical protein [Mycobacteriales bacterium]
MLTGRHHRWAVVVAAGASIAMAVPPAASAVGTAPFRVAAGTRADPPLLVVLASGAHDVTTSRGVRVRFSFAAYAVNQSQGSTVTGAGTLVVELGTTSGRETHTWTLPLTAGRLKVRSGHASLHTGKQTAPFGRFAVTASPTGAPRHASCTDGTAYTSRPVVLRGSLRFATETKRWGHVTSGRHGFQFARTSRVLAYAGDEPSQTACHTVPPPCIAATSWTATNVPSVTMSTGEDSFSGFQAAGRKHGVVVGMHLKQFGKPEGATRVDRVVIATPKQRRSRVDGHFTITVLTKPGHPWAATIAANEVESTAKETCGSHGRTMQVTTRQAGYGRGDPPLRIHEDIEGPVIIRLDNSGSTITRTRPTS